MPYRAVLLVTVWPQRETHGPQWVIVGCMVPPDVLSFPSRQFCTFLFSHKFSAHGCAGRSFHCGHPFRKPSQLCSTMGSSWGTIYSILYTLYSYIFILTRPDQACVPSACMRPILYESIGWAQRWSSPWLILPWNPRQTLHQTLHPRLNPEMGPRNHPSILG